VDALDAERVYGRILPSSGSVDKNIEFNAIKINPLVDSFLDANPNIGSFTVERRQ
jgi:hypothetical protein